MEGRTLAEGQFRSLSGDRRYKPSLRLNFTKCSSYPDGKETVGTWRRWKASWAEG